MKLNIKKINYYVKKNGTTVLSLSDDRLAFAEAALLKKDCPNDTIEVSMSNLYEIENPQFFSKSFWCDKKRRTPIANSDALVADLTAQAAPANAPWFNTTQYSSPVYYADQSTPRVPVWVVQNGVVMSSTTIHKELQKGVPIDPSWLPAVGTDGSIVIVSLQENKAWEGWQWRYNDTAKRYEVSWAGILNNFMESNGVFPIINGEKQGMRASGLSFLGGLILPEELEQRYIPHMIAFATQNPKWSYIAPATRTDGQQNGAIGLIPAGQIFQFPADYVPPANLCPFAHDVLVALRDFGGIQVDRSSCFTIYGTDPKSLKYDPYPAFYKNLKLWDVMKQIVTEFPKLKAVGF